MVDEKDIKEHFVTRTAKKSETGAVEHLDEKALRRHRLQNLITWVAGATVLIGVLSSVLSGGGDDAPTEISEESKAAATKARPRQIGYEVSHASWRTRGGETDILDDPEGGEQPPTDGVLWQDPGSSEEQAQQRDLARRYHNLDIMVAPK